MVIYYIDVVLIYSKGEFNFCIFLFVLYFHSHEIVVVNDSMMKIVQNAQNTQILVYSVGRNGNLKYHASFERNAELTDFAVCADGSKCVVSYFYDFGEPPRFSAWDTDNGTVSQLLLNAVIRRWMIFSILA